MGNYSVLSLSVDNFSDLRSFINFGALWRGEGGIELSNPEGPDTFPGSRRVASLRLFTPGGGRIRRCAEQPLLL